MLQFTGIGSAHCPDLGCCCAHFFSGENLILLDCGEDTFAALARNQILDRARGEIYCLVTHTHSDHVGSLATLCLYCASHYNKRVHVCFPTETVRTLLAIMGALPSEIDYETRFPIRIDDHTVISAVPTVHVPWMECFGYQIAVKNESLYYSGDASSIPEKILSAFRKNQVGTIYQDVSVSTEPEGPHLKLMHLCQIIPDRAERSRIFVMHFDHADYQQQLNGTGFTAVKRISGGNADESAHS